MGTRSVFLYFAFRPEKTIERAARYARQIANACPDFDFAALTYDRPQRAHKNIIELDGLSVPHWVYGKEAAQQLPYPNKVGPDFFLKPLNCDIPVLLFWKDHPEYARYWVCEDDVEYTGDMGRLVCDLQKLDANLLVTHLRSLPNDWDHIPKFRGGLNESSVPSNCRVGFLPFHAATNRALAAIDLAYRQGWAGQHEMTWPAILDRAGLSIADIGGKGPYVAEGHRGKYYIDLSPTDYEKRGSFGTKHIRMSAGREPEILWHPVKNFPDWARMMVRRSVSLWRWGWRRARIRVFGSSPLRS